MVRPSRTVLGLHAMRPVSVLCGTPEPRRPQQPHLSTSAARAGRARAAICCLRTPHGKGGVQCFRRHSAVHTSKSRARGWQVKEHCTAPVQRGGMLRLCRRGTQGLLPAPWAQAACGHNQLCNLNMHGPLSAAAYAPSGLCGRCTVPRMPEVKRFCAAAGCARAA